MSPTRIGAVSYLNTKPLIHGLRDLNGVKLMLDLPSRLAERLARRQLDIALIPLAEFLRNPDYEIVSNACIACRGEVLSVKLFSKVAPADIQSLALDEGSRTSALMAQIILSERFGVCPSLHPLPIGHGLGDTVADATLLIGDRAIQTAEVGYNFVWDLGQKWCEWYSPTFVFAVWAGRSGEVDSSMSDLLDESRDAGVRDLPAIAALEAGFVGLSPARCLSYLRDNLYFYLGEDQQDAMRLFARHAEAFQLNSESLG